MGDMKRLIVVCGLCLGLTGFVQGGPAEFFTENTKNFGTTPRGPVLQHFFAVKNTSNQTVTLGQPRVSCGCVSADIVGKTQIGPGETTHVRALMDTRRIPQANVVKTVIVYVPFLLPTYEEVQLRVQAIARDDLVVSPEALAFGTVRKGEGGSATARVTLYNDANWQVTEATSTGAYVKPSVRPVSRQGNEVTYEITAALDPECPVGNWSADVWLKTSSAGVERIRLPVSVHVVSPIAANPTTVAFGDVPVGKPSEQKVILQGTRPFKVLKINGTDGTLEAVKVADGSRPVHILKLTLTPKTAGAVSQSVEIITDSQEQPKVTVPVTGRAVRE
jgi:hypothetical protein